MTALPSRARQGAPGELTGRRVLLCFVLFFGVIFAANFALIYSALHTLHGSELENPYDASQAFNAEIAQARAQAGRGWVVNVTTRAEGAGERVTAEFRDRDGAPIPGLDVTARFEHPFDAALDREAKLGSDGLDYSGVATPLRPGRWNVAIEARRGAERMFRSENRIVVSEDSASVREP